MHRALVFTAAVLFIGAFGLLTVVYVRDSGLTAIGVIGIILFVICAVGVVGALLHPRE